MRQRLALPVPALLLAGLAACEDDGLGKLQDAGTRPARCMSDEDCAPRESCFVATGICFPRDACGPDRPCPDPEQTCFDANEDGFLDCAYVRCTDSAECSDLTCPPDKVPACVAGGCQCGAPCQGGCPDDQGCCVPEDRCYDLPPECAGLTCPPGQFVSVTSSGAWSIQECRVSGETCACEVLPPLPWGDIGLHSAMAQGPTRPLVSAYNLTYGDLMLGRVAMDGTIAWEFVDGVPSSTTSITGDLNGPRGGNSDPGEDVGLYSDIAVDGRGRPHLVYMDRRRGALRYARLDPNGWKIHTIDGEGPGETGLYASLTLDRQGRPRVAYLSAREPGTGGGRQSVLRLAHTSSDSPGSAAAWERRDLDGVSLNGLPCADRCNSDEVCRSADQACVVPDPPPTSCNSCASGERCVQGRCTAVDPLPAFRDLPRARGLWPSIATLADGTVLVAYYDEIAGNLHMLRIAGPDPRGGALSRVILAGMGSGGVPDVTGRYPSLHVTPGGEIHLAFMNVSRQALVYMLLDPGLTPIIDEEVEVGLRMGGGPDGAQIGADAALVVDRNGQARIAYQNGTTGDLRYAVRNPGGGWLLLTLAGDEATYRGSFGFYNDQILDGNRDNPLVSSYRYFLAAPNGPDNGLEIFTVP